MTEFQLYFCRIAAYPCAEMMWRITTQEMLAIRKPPDLKNTYMYMRAAMYYTN